MPDQDRRKRFIINAVYWAIVVGIVFLVTRYLLGLIWPFFMAFLVSWAMSPIIRWMTTKCHIKHSFSVAMCLLLFFGIAGGLLVVVSVNIVSWVQDLVVWLPGLYRDTILPALQSAMVRVQEFVARLDPDAINFVQSAFESAIDSLSSAVSSFSIQAVGLVSGWVTRVPGRLLSLVIFVIATVFMTADFHRIVAFLLRQMPDRTRLVVVKAKETFIAVLKKYGKSYGIIMCITFCELLVGFLILRQENAVLLALLIAVLDIFPVIGAGLFLIPWAIVNLLSGTLAKGLGLLAMYVVITVIRQFVEPRVVGHQVGLHPLVTLMAMLVGTKLFGGIGLIGLPIACAIMKSLDDTGVIHILRKEKDAAPAAAGIENSGDAGQKNSF